MVHEIQEFAHWLNRMAMCLQVLTVLIALGAIVGSLFVASYTNGSTNRIGDVPAGISLKLVAFLTAVLTSIYTGFRIRSKAADMRNAYRNLATDLMRYRIGELTAGQLVQSYRRAEHMIGNVEVEGLGDKNSDSSRPPNEDEQPPT